MKHHSNYIVATGFTTAFLGDERTLREFIVGDYLKNKIAQKGKEAVMYLVNDSYDPLNYRQLRVGVNKDEGLIKKFEKYCGRPISEIPDPFECHENYSQHFTGALLERLRLLDIYPVVLDSYHAYSKGYYSEFIAITLENYHEIQSVLRDKFNNFTIKNLLRLQCPHCLCIDSTNILDVSVREVRFDCERCGRETREDISGIHGKLSWKLDCAARWNLYGINMETFSKAHLEGLGSVAISRFMSQRFYGGKIPAIIRYGDVKISRELSYQLLEILPPEILKTLFTTHLTRDIHLNKDYVENFCREFHIRPGLSYIDYVKRELPKDALHDKKEVKKASEKSIVAYGNRFSMFFYDREYGIRLPDLKTVISVDQAAARTARQIILNSLTIRNETASKEEIVSPLIKSYLFARTISPDVYRYLRCLFGQEEGPNITTLLSILPRDYLDMIQTIIGYYTREIVLTTDNFKVSEDLLTIINRLEKINEEHENLFDSYVRCFAHRMPEKG
jgi:lysyl-tRNA synthetase class I